MNSTVFQDNKSNWSKMSSNQKRGLVFSSILEFLDYIEKIFTFIFIHFNTFTMQYLLIIKLYTHLHISSRFPSFISFQLNRFIFILFTFQRSHPHITDAMGESCTHPNQSNSFSKHQMQKETGAEEIEEIYAILSIQDFERTNILDLIEKHSLIISFPSTHS